MLSVSDIWQRYELGIDYKTQLGLYDTVARNERYFAGNQWAGVNAPDLPRPVINFLKRTCQQKVAEVNANPTAVSFEAMDFPAVVTDGADMPQTPDADADLLNTLFEADWERLKMDAVNLDGLQDACISGDYILYSYWDAAAQTGQEAKGQIGVMAVDNVNFYPGNPNSTDVQSQPYILLAQREPLDAVLREARRFGGDADSGLIAADSETQYQSGDLSRLELSDRSRCITLLCLARDPETGHILAMKTTHSALVRPQWDTRLHRYPIALMNWERRKNCCHGRAEITGLIPVQRYINQMYAMAMLFTMQSACPKPLFNQSLIKAWSTAVGAAIPVNGDVSSAAKYLAPPALPQDAYTLPERLMRTTLEMSGVSNVSLGNVTPDNTSAMLVARETSTVPLQTVRQRFYSMMEDFARNWLDMLFSCCTVPRWTAVGHSKNRSQTVLDTERLKGRLWTVHIDVGPGTLWSEATTASTLGKLFSSGAITAAQYIERLPRNYLPDRRGLVQAAPDQASLGNGTKGAPPERQQGKAVPLADDSKEAFSDE